MVYRNFKKKRALHKSKTAIVKDEVSKVLTYLFRKGDLKNFDNNSAKTKAFKIDDIIDKKISNKNKTFKLK